MGGKRRSRVSNLDKEYLRGGLQIALLPDMMFLAYCTDMIASNTLTYASDCISRQHVCFASTQSSCEGMEATEMQEEQVILCANRSNSKTVHNSA